MKQSLQLRMGQQLTMTPQLQQAIKLLQLSTLDLQQEIQEALESNPLLELEDDFNDDLDQRSESSDHDTIDNSQDFNQDASDGFEFSSHEVETSSHQDQDYDGDAEFDSHQALESSSVSEDLPMDVSWDDYLSASPVSAGVSSGSGVAADDDFVYQGETTETLQDYLLWQMRLTPMSETDQAIATAIIDAVDESGYLTVTAQDILDSLGLDDVEVDEVEVVLKRVQLFDPIGVAARSLSECLLIQLRQYHRDTPWLNEAKMLVNDHMDLLALRDYRTLMRKTKLKENELKEALDLIQSLNPKPANSVIREETSYIVPDVSVKKLKGRWVVELNADAMPKLRVNQQYAEMTRSVRNSADSQFIRSHLQEAKWFIKSLESRNDTLLKVSNCIVQQQQGFFEYGEEAMKPMVLADVAEMVDLHESTVSRVTTQKYMHTPRGIFELKFFFSSHVATDNGGECSSTAIRALIKKLISAENPSKPLSDSKIADILAEQGIVVARRTIAKYRESLFIPPSNQRKRLV